MSMEDRERLWELATKLEAEPHPTQALIDQVDEESGRLFDSNTLDGQEYHLLYEILAGARKRLAAPR